MKEDEYTKFENDLPDSMETRIKDWIWLELKNAGAVVDGDILHIDVTIVKCKPIDRITWRIKQVNNSDQMPDFC